MSSRAIVFLDDDRSELELLERCYRRANVAHPLLCFERPEHLLHYMRQARDGQCPMPALVLLDVNMVELDGFEVLELLRDEFPTYESVMLLSNGHHPRDIARAVNLGVELLSKPSGLGNTIAFVQGLSRRAAP